MLPRPANDRTPEAAAKALASQRRRRARNNSRNRRFFRRNPDLIFILRWRP